MASVDAKDNSSEYPATILVIIHGFKNKIKHKQLKTVGKELNINIIIPTENQDNNQLNHNERVELYANLIISSKPDMIIAQSSGGNVISSLVVQKKMWNGATWIISARLIEEIFKNNYESLPILFSHGTNDNLNYMTSLCNNKFSRCKLIEFDGGHYAQNLFVNNDSINIIKDLIKQCYHLRLTKPKDLTKNKNVPLTINDIMKQQFKLKNSSNK